MELYLRRRPRLRTSHADVKCPFNRLVVVNVLTNDFDNTGEGGGGVAEAVVAAAAMKLMNSNHLSQRRLLRWGPRRRLGHRCPWGRRPCLPFRSSPVGSRSFRLAGRLLRARLPGRRNRLSHRLP